SPRAPEEPTAAPRLLAPPRPEPVILERDGGSAVLPAVAVGGDFDTIEPGDRVVLIVEHDPKFAAILLNMAHDQGFKGLVTASGETSLTLAQKLKPDAVTLDIRLPDVEGWVVLDRLKHDPNTRHIPVHIISVDENKQRGLRLGAFAYLKKPVDRAALNN